MARLPRVRVGYLLAAAAFLTGCRGDVTEPLGADAPGLDVSAARLEAKAPEAKLSLKDASSSLAHSSARPWTLSKTGTVNATTSTVTWSISAVQSATTARRLVVTGQVTVRNTGKDDAPIGNVVVTLQSKAGSSWTTRASDVADATHGDAATAAQVVTGNSVTTITENSASGALSVALVPQVTVGGSASVVLDVTASFDNNILAIPVGATVRAEVLVTYGNAGPGNTPENIDIDGSGVIDANEARVDGVSALLGDRVVPAPTLVSTPVTLSDALADITTTGTATFTNAVFTLGATSGTVVVTYDGGVSGGTIRNCAHLTGTGINLETCSTQIVPREPWKTGDIITYPQEAWGTMGTTAGSLLISNFSTVYPPGELEVGIPGAGNSIALTGSSFVLALLPTSGADRQLLADETNLTSTTSGSFGGDVIALRLDVDFSDAGVTLGRLGIPFGNLTLCGVPTLPNLNNMTVRQFLGQVSSLLGGGPGIYTINQLSGVNDDLTNAFADGIVSAFADDHLFYGMCP